MTMHLVESNLVMTTLAILPHDDTTPATRAADSNPALVYLASKPSDNSRRALRGALNNVADILTADALDQRDGSRFLTVAWDALRYQHVAAIRTRLMEAYKPATANLALSAVRGVLKEAWRLGLVSAEDYQRAADVENIKAETLPVGRDLSGGEIMALARACSDDQTAAGARDNAIIGLLATAGLRRSEVAALLLADVDTTTGKISIRSGKGRKDRTVYATNGTLAALHDWLSVRGSTGGALFCPINKGGKLTVRPMTAQAIYTMLQKRGQSAGVVDFTPHDFRRTVVGDLLDAGVDLVTVAKLAGHASVETTARYDRRPEELKRDAAKKLHYPHQRRRPVVE